MNEKTIAELVEAIISDMNHDGLKPKTIADFKRYGIRPILKYYSETGQVCYSRKQTQEFVNNCKKERENGNLPEYKWRRICRAATLLEQYEHEEHRTRELQILSAEAHTKDMQLDEIEALIVAVRGEVLKLDYSEKTKRHYIYSGLGTVLRCFHLNNCHEFSKSLLFKLVDDLHNDYAHGKFGRYKYCIVRKTVAWLCEFRETGKISLGKLNAYSFKRVNEEYEALINEYILYSLKVGVLKESSIKIYSGLVRRFFRIIESRGVLDYKLLTLPEVSNSIVEYGAKNSRSTGSLLDALRSFAKFISEIHTELPDIFPALIGIPAHHKRVYEGFSRDDALKILDSVDRNTALGKRDYAMMLLAYNTGLRGVDITNLRFNDIDWSSNEIRLIQQKTEIPIALPFDNETGNAIADYILNARPDSDCNNIFLRAVKPYTALSSQSPWTIFFKVFASRTWRELYGKTWSARISPRYRSKNAGGGSAM